MPSPIGEPREPGLYGDERIWAAATEAKHMFRAGVLLADVLDSLRAWNRGRCKPPLDERELTLCAEASLRAVIAPTPRWTPEPRVTVLPLKPEVGHV